MTVRVCFFNRSYWPDTGATGQLLTELAEDLVAHHACQVTVVTGQPLHIAAAPARETRNGVAIIRASGTTFNPRRFAGRAANYLTYFLSALVAAWRVPPCDVCVALTDPPIIGLAALAAARRRHAKFVFACHDVFPEVAALLQDFRSPLVDAALDRINRQLLRSADAVVVLGDSMKRRLVSGKGADPRKIAIVHNWADSTLLAPAAQRNTFAADHHLEGRFVVMHSGNIGLSQNLEMVLDAAEQLRGDRRVTFVMVGDGSSRVALEAAAARRQLGNVLFLPYQPRAAMRDSYAAADVFLVSLKSGLSGYIVPSKVYSIIAAGKPFIAAIEEDSEAVTIAREHGCGLVVPPGDANALAQAILALAGDPARVAHMARRAREASAQFDRPRQVAEYARVLAHVTRE